MQSLDCKPLEIAECKEIGRTCACFKVRKAARAITKLYEDVLRPSGLRATQFSLLMATRVSPSNPGKTAGSGKLI